MKIIAISDLHGDTIPPDDLPNGDVLVIAGDILPDDYTPEGRDQKDSSRVLRQGWWFNDIWIPYLVELRTKFPSVVWIAGNHDFYFQGYLRDSVEDQMPNGVHYLRESNVVIDGIKFYGAPWNMTRGWAFAIDEREYAQKLGEMPTDVDVLITHGPPKVDGMPGVHWTSQILGDWIELTPMKAVICGHIHGAYGEYAIGDTPIYVVSSKNRNYELVNPPLEIEI